MLMNLSLKATLLRNSALRKELNLSKPHSELFKIEDNILVLRKSLPEIANRKRPFANDSDVQYTYSHADRFDIIRWYDLPHPIMRPEAIPNWRQERDRVAVDLMEGLCTIVRRCGQRDSSGIAC